MDARKDDTNKARFDLIPPRPLYQLAEVYTAGAKKYTDRNWEKGMKWGRIFGAVMRHLWSFWMGENNDRESGQPHLAHAAWGCLTLLEYIDTHPEMDDRPYPAQTNEPNHSLISLTDYMHRAKGEGTE